MKYIIILLISLIINYPCCAGEDLDGNPDIVKAFEEFQMDVAMAEQLKLEIISDARKKLKASLETEKKKYMLEDNLEMAVKVKNLMDLLRTPDEIIATDHSYLLGQWIGKLNGKDKIVTFDYDEEQSKLVITYNGEVVPWKLEDKHIALDARHHLICISKRNNTTIASKCYVNGARIGLDSPEYTKMAWEMTLTKKKEGFDWAAYRERLSKEKEEQEAKTAKWRAEYEKRKKAREEEKQKTEQRVKTAPW